MITIGFALSYSSIQITGPKLVTSQSKNLCGINPKRIKNY